MLRKSPAPYHHVLSLWGGQSKYSLLSFDYALFHLASGLIPEPFGMAATTTHACFYSYALR